MYASVIVAWKYQNSFMLSCIVGDFFFHLLSLLYVQHARFWHYLLTYRSLIIFNLIHWKSLWLLNSMAHHLCLKIDSPKELASPVSRVLYQSWIQWLWESLTGCFSLSIASYSLDYIPPLSSVLWWDWCMCVCGVWGVTCLWC